MELTTPRYSDDHPDPQSFGKVILATVVVVALGIATVYPVHLPISYYESDFLDYCVGIEALDDIKLKAPSKRSNLAALLPYGLAKYLGVINGLAVSSILCTAAMVMIALRWVQQIQPGPLSLWTTAAVALAMGPLMSLLKIINFYPLVVLATFVGAWWIANAWRRPTAWTVFLAGCSVPLVMMIDVRGLVWGLWYALLLVPVLIVGIRRRGWWLLPAVATPMYIGWHCGKWSYHRLHSPLSRQLDIRPLYHKIDPDNPLYQPPHLQPDGFLWGRSSPQELVDELLFLLDQTRMPTPPEFYQFSTVSQSVQWYWTVLAGVTLVSAVWLARRRHKEAGRAALIALPFFFAFWKLPDVVEPHIRFYAQCLPGLLVIIAVAFGDALQRLPRWGQGASLLGMVATSMLVVPHWGVSRVMLNAHVEMAMPEAIEIHEQNGLIRGYEVHLYVSPTTKQERMLERNWLTICNNRLAEDGVLVPFYQRLKAP